MKFSFKKLVAWYVITYLVFTHQDDLMQYEGFAEAFNWLFDFQQFVLVVTSCIAFASYAILSYSIFYFFYKQVHPLIIIFLVVLSILFSVGFRYFIQEIIQEWIFGFGNYYEISSIRYYILDNLYYAFVFTGFGIIYFFIQYSRHQEGQAKQSMIEQKKMELAFLRSQLNPHFLFNTLNNIYTLVYSKSTYSLNAIEKLSHLLRYAVYEQEQTVSLDKEFEHLLDYIELEKIRYPGPVALEINVEKEVLKYYVAPFMLIPFVENAFKHGSLEDPEQPIRINLSEHGDFLYFHVFNYIVEHNHKDEMSGVGLENIKKRLALLYGNQHELQIEKQDQIFSVQLKISKSVCSEPL